MKPKKRIQRQIKATRFHIAIWAIFLVLSLVRGYGIPSGTGYLIAFIAAILLGLGVAIYMAITIFKIGKPKSPRWWLVAASLLLLSLSLFTRVPSLHDFSTEVLEGDPLQYIHEAKTTPLTSTLFLAQKSPFFDFVVLAAGTVAGWEAGMMRGLALVLSVSWIPVLLILGRRLVGQNAAFTVGAFFTTLPTWAWMGVRGLREDLSLTVMLLVIILFLKLHEQVTRKRVIAFVALCAVLLLIRFDALPLLGLAALISFIFNKELRKTMALSIGVFALLFAVSSVSQQLNYGSATYHSNMYARWFANQEFVGQPGFPQLNASGGMDDSYAGPKISLADYIIGMHDPALLVGRAIGNTLFQFPVGTVFFWLGDGPRVGGEAPMLGINQAGGKYFFLMEMIKNREAQAPGTTSRLIGSLTFYEVVILTAGVLFFVFWVIGSVLFIRSEYWIVAMIPLAAMFALFYLPIAIFPWRVIMYAFPLMCIVAVLGARRLSGHSPPTVKHPDAVTGSVW